MWKILVHSVVCLPVPQLEFIYLYLSKIAISCEFVVFLFVTKWLKGKKEKIGGFFLDGRSFTNWAPALSRMIYKSN